MSDGSFPGIGSAVRSQRSPATVVAAGRSRVEMEVLRLQGLLKSRQIQAALAGAQALLGEVPENRDVLYIVAVAQRYQRQIPAALATLERLERLHPEYSRIFQERGHCLMAAGE